MAKGNGNCTVWYNPELDILSVVDAAMRRLGVMKYITKLGWHYIGEL